MVVEGTHQISQHVSRHSSAVRQRVIAELLSANFYATGNIIMFPCSTSTCLQGVVALGPIAFLIVSPNLVVIYCLILKLFIHKFKLGLCGPLCESLTH